MERTPEQRDETAWNEYMEGKVMDDLILELEGEGIAVSEQDVIEEHEYRIHENDFEDSLIESNMS